MGRNKGDKDKGPRSPRRVTKGYAGSKLWGMATAPLRLGAVHSSNEVLVLLNVYERAVRDSQGRVAALGGVVPGKKAERAALKKALTEDAQRFLAEVHAGLPIPPRPNIRPRVDADDLGECILRTIGQRIKERRRRA